VPRVPLHTRRVAFCNRLLTYIHTVHGDDFHGTREDLALAMSITTAKLDWAIAFIRDNPADFSRSLQWNNHGPKDRGYVIVGKGIVPRKDKGRRNRQGNKSRLMQVARTLHRAQVLLELDQPNLTPTDQAAIEVLRTSIQGTENTMRAVVRTMPK
jgi:hypothetical protein